MATYNIQNFKVATTLAAQRIVVLNGTAGTVAYPTNLQKLPIGITLDDVKDITQGIPVAGLGSIARLYFNDSIAASGDLVASDSSGRGVPYALPNTTASATLSAAFVGVLVGAAVNVTGTIADVLVCPQFGRVGL